MKSDYDFWRDLATIASYLLLALSILSARFLSDTALLIAVLLFWAAITWCGVKMFFARRSQKKDIVTQK